MTSTSDLDRFFTQLPIPLADGFWRRSKKRGGCSIDKETGLCAGDIEQRVEAGAAYRLASHADIREGPGGRG